MYKTIFPISNSTLYERYPDRNTSTDQILELWPIKQGQPTKQGADDEFWSYTYNSRILLKFNLTELSSSVHGREFEVYLKLNATEAELLQTTYTLYAYPLSGSFTVGNGFFNNNPEITNGVSWNYKSSKVQGQRWLSGSYDSNTTGSYSSNAGGGNWYTNVSGSQTFENDTPDVRMNVTNIVKGWLSGSYDNNGFIVKYADQDEQSLDFLGKLQFFSLHTHTIYIPRLEIYWNDVVLSGTGSFSEVSSTDQITYIKNLKDVYFENEKPTLRLGSRSKYPAQTYSTSSNYLVEKRLPLNSYYQIQDSVTDEVIVPFNTLGTKVNCDSNGNYIKLDCTSLLTERYYKLIFKCEYDDGTVNYVDQNYTFRITRH